ncbi:5-formyltetrahydrofolate cyclo-ligase [Corynebacterium sp. 320]|nr:5-formyltetrahydrofolate cyclo-ligase [Corynebacterium sp. 320]KAB1552801.1 5-formyltetrahydrofolate cyclo-ligase [Corynebacterium sp. 321]KAB1553981.1 5-formyltetrahydrofolate cyclo-ligase [Corynebacterium sp. 319]KAB3528237.1 5-formyltetrahydrofolate cyclo-ligase [Corynebacterium sp. 250]KAB3540276.1 5-formyltetrahydrofolate cyclo-ligase [Corynebacterium sp. 366]
MAVMDNPTDISQAKRDLRASTRARRESVSPEQRAARDQMIQAHLVDYLRRHQAETKRETQTDSANAGRSDAPLTVTAFVPMDSEPGGRWLPDVLRAAGFRVILPRVAQKNLEWVPYTGDLERSSWGLMEPTDEKISQPLPEVVDVAIIPAIGLDSAGHRLGQGGGFYDRQLAQGNLNVTRLGIVDQWEFHTHVPHASHDLTVNTVITEHSVFEM